jgi:hypothetical protein
MSDIIDESIGDDGQTVRFASERHFMGQNEQQQVSPRITEKADSVERMPEVRVE